MNRPFRPLAEEIERIAELGFDFVDLTLEPPHTWPADGRLIRTLLCDNGLDAVGHTAPYLPIASPFPELAERARELFRSACSVLAEAGVRLVTVHPDDRVVHAGDRVARNAEAIARLSDDAQALGVGVMVENLGRSFARVEDLAPIFEAAPAVRFHLDAGHANLRLARGEGNRVDALLAAFGERLAHVHLHDNIGVRDLHLPLGVGTVDWPSVAGSLKRAGWDGTATLEVSARAQSYIETSRRLWLEWWTRA